MVPEGCGAWLRRRVAAPRKARSGAIRLRRFGRELISAAGELPMQPSAAYPKQTRSMKERAHAINHQTTEYEHEPHNKMREWLPPERAASAGLTPGPEFPGARNSINSSSKLPVDPVIRYAVLCAPSHIRRICGQIPRFFLGALSSGEAAAF